MISHYTVSGMTCEHCRQHVTKEVSAIPGVAAVEVDLASGHLDVTSAAPIAFDAIAAAVDEAGGGDYSVVAG
jgi:copper chaperone CopZ